MASFLACGEHQEVRAQREKVALFRQLSVPQCDTENFLGLGCEGPWESGRDKDVCLSVTNSQAYRPSGKPRGKGVLQRKPLPAPASECPSLPPEGILPGDGWLRVH